MNSLKDDKEAYILSDVMPNMDSINDVLNSPITDEEIKCGIVNMKNHKSSGNDMIINEYITSTCDFLLPVYVQLFNLILDLF